MTKRITYRIKKGTTTHGFDESQVALAITAGLNRWRFDAMQHGLNLDVAFVPVDRGEQITIGSRVTKIKGKHYRGWFKKPKSVDIHNGNLDGTFKKVFTSQKAIEQIVAHEFGHFMGLVHSSNKSHIMHTNASAPVIHKSEIQEVIKRMGLKTKPRPTPDT